MSALQIAIDVMSGDCGPSVCVPAALGAAREFPDVRFILIGGRAELDARLAAAKLANVDCIFTTQVVEMTDHPRGHCGVRRIPRCAARSTSSRRTRRMPA